VLRRWVGDGAWEVLWRRIRRIRRSRHRLFREKLGYLECGLITLLQALYADVEKNGHRSTIRRMAREAVK
jgi:hypothetical protein